MGVSASIRGCGYLSAGARVLAVSVDVRASVRNPGCGCEDKLECLCGWGWVQVRLRVCMRLYVCEHGCGCERRRWPMGKAVAQERQQSTDFFPKW